MANIGSRLTEKDDQGTITEIDEHTRHAIDLLKSMQNPLQDYADIVGAPAFAHGYRYVYPEPEDYAIETAIIALEERSRNRWIPVTERLPEKDGFYLATHDGEICGEEEPFVGLADLKMGSGLMMKRIISAFLHGNRSPHRTSQQQSRTTHPAAGWSRWQAHFWGTVGYERRNAENNAGRNHKSLGGVGHGYSVFWLDVWIRAVT